MRKLIFLLVLLLGALPFAASAQVTTDDLTTLAAYAPSDTVVFTAFRTDDDFITTLDGYAAALTSNPDLNLPPGVDVTTGLDLIAAEAGLDGTFAENTEWLGDTAALAFVLDSYYAENPSEIYEINLNDVLQPIIMLEITDRDAAATQLVSTLETLDGIGAVEFDVNGETAFVYTFFEEATEPGEFDTTMIFREDHVIIGPYGGVLNFTASEANLANNADFLNIMDLLPGDSYNAVGYGNQPAAVEILTSALDALTEAGETETFFYDDMQYSLDVYESAGSVGLGAVIADGDVFTLEAVMDGRNGEADFNLANIGSVDFAFAENITTRFPIVIHSTNLAGIINEALTTATELEPDTEDAVAEADAATEAEFGLTLEQIYGWMTNDFALILGPSVQAADASNMMDYISALPVEFGILIDPSADRAAAVTLVDAIETTLNEELVSLEDAADFTLEREGDLLTLTAVDNTGNVPFPVTIQVGITPDDIFVLGTPGTTMPGDPLTSSETFGTAAATLLDSPSSVYYLDFTPLGSLLEPLQNLDPAVVTTKGVIETLEFATISVTVDENSNAFGRAALGLRSE